MASLLETGRTHTCAALRREHVESRVVLFGTEGDTDPAIYRQVVGRSADELRQ